MKKYTFLVYHKQYHDFLERIKEIGVLHIAEKPEGIEENDELREKMQTAARVQNALKQLKRFRPKDAVLAPADLNRDGVEVLNEVEELLSKQESLLLERAQTEKERERMEVWGRFSHERIQQLRDAGFVLNFFSTSTRRFDQEWEVLYNAFEIDREASTIYFVTITSPGEKIDIDADHIILSDKTAEELDTQINHINDLQQRNRRTLDEMAVNDYNTLKEAEADILTAIMYDKVVLNTNIEADNKVMLLEGWTPEESQASLNEYLDTTDIYYEVNDPVENERVPIKLKNNKFASMFEFIGELYDLPNYWERDLTAYFAPFYVIFFGLCLGDAGYGLLFLILGLFMRPRMKDPVFKSVMSLIAVLGAGSIVMGIISGSFFGYSLIDSPAPWIQKFKAIIMDSNMLFYNALILGVIQILFGMVLKWTGEVKRFGFLASLSTLGWLFLFLGCGGTFLAVTFLGLSPAIAKWLYILFGGLSVLCIFILNDVKRNPLMNIGSGLWNTYNMATGLLGDILSYIRLFALGLSGSVMGLVFNDLALSFGTGIGGIILAAVILLFGHSINIFIAALGAFVHPMRLTFVEFYKNAGFEGSGKKYKPFAKYKEETKVL